MASDWQLPEVERVFAQAAFGTTSWNDAMETVAEVARGIGAIMHPVPGKQSTLPFSRSLSGQAESYLRDGWVHRDVRFQCLPALLRNGVCSEDDYITPAEMDRHPYYQDFLARFGLRWFAALKVSAGEECWALSLQRTATQGPFFATRVEKVGVSVGEARVRGCDCERARVREGRRRQPCISKQRACRVLARSPRTGDPCQSVGGALAWCRYQACAASNSIL